MNTHQTSTAYAVVQIVLLCAFAVAFLVDDSRWLFPPGTPSTIGTVLSGVGLLLLLAAFLSIRDVIQIAPEPRADGRLVTRGVYSRLRHPIYTAMAIIVTGLFLRKPTIPVAIAGAVVIVWLIIKGRFEERLLRARYPEYAEYQARTWGVIPWPHRSHYP